ncbi:hypothetical protein SKAU_G00232570 [Synaphobranchus kaupii]|uniref:VWFA domain-containing protein n=1 Tax=Synaphobranchus kaupii TaxID=118154 RepID=A0A9Q1F5Y5_SYNKA|nr:hypothetical protein SKAU_G00232570 [Synaphobranchus kaupii]
MRGWGLGRSHGGTAESVTNKEVDALISSPAWLKIHGLKESKLCLSQVFVQIGFKHSEDYVHSLRKPVSSQYAEGMFYQFMKDGAVHNLTASPQQLQELCERLERKARLYQRRLDWLTTGSRQLFGVIQERTAALVLDFGRASGAQFQLIQDSVCLVLREQVSYIFRFNLIRSSPRMERWQDKAVASSDAHIDSAVEWVWRLKQEEPPSGFDTAEAVLKAMADSMVEAVYLFTVGDFADSLTDLLKNKLVKNVCPIHTVSFNAKKKETIKVLKELSQLTAGRFHVFAEMRDSDGRDGHPARMPAKPIGGVPPGAGVREDVFLVWREMEEARTTRARLQAILMNISPSAPEQEPADCEPAVMPWSEDYLSSRAWLSQYGLKAQKLLLFDALADCAFRHSDGVVDVRVKPGDESVQTDAETNHKLVNAKYCNRFVHMRWKDGSLAHVYVSADKCRRYEERMKTALENMQRRLEWLSRGSRELFGAVLEERVYILLDTSESMKDQLPLVKDKIHQLVKEQLQHKTQVNIVTFGSRAAAWREKLVEVSPQSLENAWSWVKGLQAGGSTNTLGALRLALADIGTQAVYLLTDGRPDQPTGTILEQVQLCPTVPVHTISFNCKDPEANHFLYQLAQETGGRYHCFPCGPQEPGAPMPYMSEDTHLLKAEIEQGKKVLESFLKIRAECVMLDWYHNGDITTAKRSGERPCSAPWRQNAERPRSALGCVPAPCLSHRPQIPTTQAQSSLPRPARHAAQTKTSLLRFLSKGVGVGNSDRGALQEWMLPETLSLFQTNTNKQKQVLSCLELTPLDDSQKKPKRKTPTESLSMSSACWLRTNSLVARRLTIIDALAPTAIKQNAKFIPVLEKHIYSKVFEEVFPLAHVSSSTGRLTLVNPQAVNLEHYKTRLQGALQDYQRRLDLIVWKALTQEERDKFGSDKPVRFQEHREALLQALESLGWPLPQEDVSLLEDQISMALSFLQQASDLQQAAKQTSGTRDVDKRSEGPSSRAQGTKPRRALDTLRGQSVLARSEADGFYYPGTVRKRLARNRVIVDFGSGDTEVVPLGSLITMGGAAPCPPLKVGDFVLVGSAAEGADNRFVPGVVIATPRRLEPSDKLYTVLKYDSRKMHSLRSKMVKISQTRYDLTCRQLRQRHGELQRLERRRRTGSTSVQKAVDRKASQTERRKKNRTGEASRALLPPSSPDLGRYKDKDLESRQDGSRDGRDSLGDKSHRSYSPSRASSQTRTPTPRLERDSLNARQTPGTGSPTALADDRMQALAQDLLLALEQHRGQQEEIQRYIKALSLHHLDNDDGQQEQREMTNQQQEALEKLQELIPPTTGPANQDQGDPGGVPEYVNRARLLMPKVSPGQEVLARWAHDGWYYYSSVVHACGDQSYFLQSREGELERVWREDIITEGQDSSQEIKVEDPVIGAHPLYSDRYCPGVVLTITEDLQTKLRYYDGSEVLVSREQLFLIPAQKFQTDVAYMLECEERWVGQLVVARSDHTGTYLPAEVRQRVGNGKQYLVRWADGTSAVQDREWIFGKWSRTQTLGVGDYVLALADPASLIFLPGVVHGSTGTLLHIQFINRESQSAGAHHCFWLSEEQFNTAAQLYASQQWCRTEEEEDEEEEGGGEDTEDELDESVYSTDSSTSNL